MIDDLKFRLVKNSKSSISLYVKYADASRNLINGTIGDGVKILTIENGELKLHKISKIGGIRRNKQGYIKLLDRINKLYSGITQNYTNANEYNCTNLKFELKKGNSYCRYGVRKYLALRLQTADSGYKSTLIRINPSGKMIICRLGSGYGFAVNYGYMIKLNYER